MQQLYQHKADGVVEACRHARPEDRKAQRGQRKLGQRGEGHDQATACGLAHHAAVFAAVAGDVVLAGLSAALCHLGSQQRGIGGHQRAQAAALYADGDQVGHQLRGLIGAVSGQQAVQQAAHPHDACAYLTQTEDQAHGDAFGLHIGIDRCNGRAAGVQTLAQPGGSGIAPVCGAQRQHDFHAQVFHIVNQGVKGLFLAGLLAHAQAQLGGKAGGENLARAVGDGVQQIALPQADAFVLRWRRHQCRDAGHLRAGQPVQPAGVELVGKDQHEQLGGVHRLRRAGQQLVAQALGHFAGHGGARRKAKIGQQGGDVHRFLQFLPPPAQALQGFGVGFKGLHGLIHAHDGVLCRGLGSAYPLHQMDQPQMALGKVCVGVDRRQQTGQIKCAFLHSIRLGGPQCSTRFSGVGMTSPVSFICSTNRGTSTSKVSPS